MKSEHRIYKNGKKPEKKERKPLSLEMKAVLIAKAKELIPEQGISPGVLLKHLRHWCIWGSAPVNGKIAGKHTVAPDHESWHPTSQELKEIVSQVQEDNKPTPVVVEPIALGLPK